MPGKLCDGTPETKTILRNSKAFCEGFDARARDNAAANIYDATANPIDYADYQAGIDYGATLAGQTISGDQAVCCGVRGLTVPA